MCGGRVGICAFGAAEAQTLPAKGTKSSDSRANSRHQQHVRDAKILADAETLFPMDDNLVLRGYSNRPWIAQPATVTHAIVMIHGVLRNPDKYYLSAKRVLDRKSLFTKVALISVGFDRADSAPKNSPRLARIRS